MLGKHWRRRSAHTRIATYPSLPPIPSPPRRPCARRGPAPQITSKPIPHHRLVSFAVLLLRPRQRAVLFVGDALVSSGASLWAPAYAGATVWGEALGPCFRR